MYEKVAPVRVAVKARTLQTFLPRLSVSSTQSVFKFLPHDGSRKLCTRKSLPYEHFLFPLAMREREREKEGEREMLLAPSLQGLSVTISNPESLTNLKSRMMEQYQQKLDVCSISNSICWNSHNKLLMSALSQQISHLGASELIGASSMVCKSSTVHNGQQVINDIKFKDKTIKY
jgi:hypothetical protein